MGNYKSAFEWLQNTENSANQIVIDGKTKEMLSKLHPEGKDCYSDALLKGPKELFQGINFEQVNSTSLYQSALKLSGSAGPSGLNAHNMKVLLCSKRNAKQSEKLCQVLAELIKRLGCDLVDPSMLETFTASRCIAIPKSNNKIRPIGVVSSRIRPTQGMFSR